MPGPVLRPPQPSPAAPFRPIFRRPLLVAVVGVALAVAIAATSCGPDEGAEDSSPQPTIGRQVASTGEAATTETESKPVGPPLEPGADAETIVAAVGEALGRHDDVAAVVRRFGPFPELSTPEGAVVVGLRTDARRSIDGAWMVTTTEVTLEAPAPVPELAERYITELAELGYETGASPADRTGRPTPGSAPTSTRRPPTGSTT